MKSEEEISATFNRRRFLGNTALLTAGLLLAKSTSWADVFLADSKKQKYKVAVVDLMILKRQKLGAFQLTKDIGADGLEVDMGGLGNRPTFESQLAAPEIRQQFSNKAKELNLEICSLAMTGFYAQSYAERDGVDRMVQDCIDTAKAMNVKVAFLPLGVCDLVKKPELRPAVIERLKAIAPKAEAAGVTIGIETSLAAADEAKLLDEVGSAYVKSYFNFANACDNGRDVSQELEILGRKRICQIHCTDTDGVWLQNDPKIDMKKVKKTLEKMKWSGWLVIARSRDKNDTKNVKGNFSANTAYVKSIFQS
ncbi:sugar phosphate isomerase/epimerase family protein [Mucilaginibacter paludis]|uniref:Xylose isomerase domain-containing protein TIM barrel n=1 Tax=Mucilaginibacter paludis DSM 18603 TaxID=714943 RepID=H1YEN8_9SPHI|nr:sugar phosphate isomerase/epimerase family protein [Mucilaginibacter paludis]EHQ30798.1 Xylose isomerase domain-containing protein TIM barrel [Mucilaginibacter paludis DSM 18603]